MVWDVEVVRILSETASPLAVGDVGNGMELYKGLETNKISILPIIGTINKVIRFTINLKCYIIFKQVGSLITLTHG